MAKKWLAALLLLSLVLSALSCVSSQKLETFEWINHPSRFQRSWLVRRATLVEIRKCVEGWKGIPPIYKPESEQFEKLTALIKPGDELWYFNMIDKVHHRSLASGYVLVRKNIVIFEICVISLK